MLKAPHLFNTFSIGLSIALIYLPVSALVGMSREASKPFFTRMVAEYLAPHLLGPVVALLASLTVRLLLFFDLQIPKWVVLIGAIGAVYSITALRGGYAHDFSHIICDQCTGYGRIILVLAAATSVSLALTSVSQSRHTSSSGPAIPSS